MKSGSTISDNLSQTNLITAVRELTKSSSVLSLLLLICRVMIDRRVRDDLFFFVFKASQFSISWSFGPDIIELTHFSIIDFNAAIFAILFDGVKYARTVCCVCPGWVKTWEVVALFCVWSPLQPAEVAEVEVPSAPSPPAPARHRPSSRSLRAKASTKCRGSMVSCWGP